MEATGVLIVDDERRTCEMLSNVLAEEGFRVETAVDGAQALSKLQKGRFSAVLTDLKMPGMGGMELLRSIREKNPYIAVMIMTGYPSVETMRESMQLLGDDYVSKPVDPTDLTRAIKAAVKQHELSYECDQLAREMQDKRLEGRESSSLELIRAMRVPHDSLNELAAETVKTATAVVDAEAATLALLSEDERELVLMASLLRAEGVVRPERQVTPLHLHPHQEAIKRKELITYKPGQLGTDGSRLQNIGRAHVAVPLLYKQKALGILAVYDAIYEAGPAAIRPPQEVLLRLVARKAAHAVELRRFLEARN